MSAPASQPQLERKHLDKDQGPDSLRSVLRLIQASIGGPSNSKLSSYLRFGRDVRVGPLVTLGEITKPLLLLQPAFSSH